MVDITINVTNVKENKSKLLEIMYTGIKRDGQKYHSTLRTYGGWKTTNFLDIEGIMENYIAFNVFFS